MADLPPSAGQIQELVRLVQSTTFLNRQLAQICAVIGKSSAGVKAELQRRIVEAIAQAVSAQDHRRFRELERSIWLAKGYTKRSGPPANSPVTYAPAPAPPLSRPPEPYSYGSTNGSMRHLENTSGGGMMPYYPNGARAPLLHGLTFKPSPFYELEGPIGVMKTCEVMAQHRHTVSFSIRAQDHPLLAQIPTDSSIRVMMFCSSGNVGPQDISFPHQSELKVNGGDIKVNLRGLKNKPGSTRPADITDHLRLRIPSYTNNVEFTYALTTKKYYVMINICRKMPMDNLLAKIGSRRISKASVIAELTQKANDAEIELSSQVLSLKCPLSYMRLATPCRSTTCAHVSCFDATSYLQLQEQGPQWICPICSKSAPFDRLAVDEYVKDILQNTSSSLEQVEIGPTGIWKAPQPQLQQIKTTPRHDSYALDDDSDDDLPIANGSKVTDSINGTNGHQSYINPLAYPPTPVNGQAHSREASAVSRSGAGAKRTRDEVVDLTLSSDDEDDLPRPPAKRPNLGGPSS